MQDQLTCYLPGCPGIIVRKNLLCGEHVRRWKCSCAKSPHLSIRHRRALVYFVRNEYLIKVGTTTGQHWNAYGGQLLGTMPGHYDVEKWVCRQFRHLLHYRYSREWFRADPELTAFVETYATPGTPSLLGRPR